VPRLVRAPRYPISARDDRRAGEVLVRAAVDAEGRPTPLGVEDAGGLGRAFERRALAAVGGWRFEPARVDGRAVASEVIVPVVFTPPRDFNPDLAQAVPLPYGGGLFQMKCPEARRPRSRGAFASSIASMRCDAQSAASPAGASIRWRCQNSIVAAPK
jgi:protein TonB